MTEQSRFEIQYAPAAARQLDGKPVRRIRAAVDGLAADPRSEGCRQLTGQQGRWRIRVGDFRVVYEVNDQRLLVLVVTVAHRREVYR